MTEFRQTRRTFYKWLVRIEFPRMHIEYERLLFFFINASQGPPNYGIREESKVAAAGDWDILAQESHCRDRKFYYEL